MSNATLTAERPTDFSLTLPPDAPEHAPQELLPPEKKGIRNAGGGFGKNSRAGITIVAKIKAHTEEIRAELQGLKEGKGYSLEDLEKYTKVSKAMLSKYLKGEAVGNVAKQETLITDFLKQERMRDEAAETDVGELFETFVSRKLRGICERTQTRGFLAAVYGVPGLGKTCAIMLYRRDDRVCVSFELNKVTGGGTPNALVRHFFREVDTASWDPRDETKGEWIIERFKGSKRLVIIDNAHLLNNSGLEWVLGFHDATGCPMVLIGNSELKRTMRLVRRAQSRFGILEHLKTTDAENKSKFTQPVREFLEKRWPSAAKEIFKPALELADSSGALRALRLAVGYAKDLLSGKEAPTATQAFAIAVSKLPTNARLNAK